MAIRIDNYYWLRDDTRSQPEVLDYLQQENSYGHRVMASQQALQDRILKEIIDRIPQREVSAPYIKMATAIGIFMNQAVNMLSTSVNRRSVKSGTSGKHCSMPTSARLIVSFIRWAEWRLRQITPLWHWQKIFFPDGSTAFVFVIWKQVTGYPELLDNVEPSFVWANDSWTFYYVRKHPVTLLPYQVWRHAIGTPASQDKLIYEEKTIPITSACIKRPRSIMWSFIWPAPPPVKFACWTRKWPMPSRLFFCLAAKITNTALITTSIGFICVPTATVKLWLIPYPYA